MTELVRLEIEEREDVVVARVAGELDLDGAPRTGDAIEARMPAAARGLLVDFSALDFIDSSGVAMLFRLDRLLTSRRQKLRVVAVPGKAVARVLDIVNFERAAPVDATVDDALRALRRAGHGPD
jgi:anti-sigma B factor antagonist